MPTKNAILEVKSLELTFSSDFGESTYLKDVSFNVYPGEILGIVGESGSGKSITSLAIMGLLPKNGRISAGEILFRGQNLAGMRRREIDRIRGNKLTMIFQDALTSLNPVFTIGNQVQEAVRAHRKLTRREAYDEALRLLERVGLPRPAKVMRQYPHTLSGGMRQRVMIAMAIAGKPDLIIADEPTTALDVTVQAQIMALLKSLAKEENCAVVLITHDIGLIAQMADRVLVMYAGQAMESCDLKTVFEDPRHPYTMALLRSVPSITDNADRQLRSIRGVVPAHYSEISGCRFADRCEFTRPSCIRNEQRMSELSGNHHVRCERAAAGDYLSPSEEQENDL